MSGILIGGTIYGSIYVLVALGLVVIYRTTGGITFAQGDVGLAGTYVGIGLVFGPWGHIPLWFGVIIGVIAAALFNIIVYFLTVWRVQAASSDYRGMIVGTLAAGLIIEAVAPLIFGYNLFNIPLFHGTSLTIAGTQVPTAGLIIVISALAALFAFIWFLFKTRLGMSLRMIASNNELAKLSGLSPVKMNIIVWGLAGALSGWALTLYGAYQYTSVSSATPFLLAAAVAASWGAFRSIPLTLFGALFLGISNDLAERYVAVPLLNTISLGILIVVFVLRTNTFSLNAATRKAKRNLESSHGLIGKELRPIRPLLVKSRLTRSADFGLVSIVLIGLMLLWRNQLANEDILINLLSLVCVICGLGLPMLYGGRINLATAAYMAIGAYVVYICQHSFGIAPVAAVLVAVPATMIVGAVFGALTSRMVLMFYATLSLVFTLAIPEIASDVSWTGGENGVPVPGWLSNNTVWGIPTLVIIFLAITIAVMAVRQLIGLRRTGARWLFMAFNPQAGEESALRRLASSAAIDAIAAGMFALGGILTTQVGGYIAPAGFPLSVSIYALAALVIGGGWSLTGVAIGCGVVTYVPQELAGIEYWPQVIFGALLIVILLVAPGGVEGSLAALGERVRTRIGGRKPVDGSFEGASVGGSPGHDGAPVGARLGASASSSVAGSLNQS